MAEGAGALPGNRPESERGSRTIVLQVFGDQGDIAALENENPLIGGLTRLANRRGFDEYLLKEWRRHVRMHHTLSILLCDIDYFKLYNDHYGQKAGDACLQAVTTAINQGFRSNDLVARFGGDEFMIVLPHTRLEGAVKVAERVRANVEAAGLPHAMSRVDSRVTISIGVACTIPRPQDAGDGSGLILRADRNLHLAKRLGRNRVNYEDLDQAHDDASLQG